MPLPMSVADLMVALGLTAEQYRELTSAERDAIAAWITGKGLEVGDYVDWDMIPAYLALDQWRPAPPIPPVIPIAFIDSIFSFVWDISDWFLEASRVADSWWWPFNYISVPLYAIYQITNALLTPIAHFGDWAADVWSKVLAILTAEGILGLIKWWFPDLGNVIEWFINRWNWLISAVGDWWDETKTNVLGWITAATEGLKALGVWWDEFWKITWPDWLGQFDLMRSEWDEFWTVTWPNLVSFNWLGIWWASRLADVNGLIDSALSSWFPFYDDLVNVWNEVLEFFVDPGEFLLSRFADWFLGPEE